MGRAGSSASPPPTLSCPRGLEKEQLNVPQPQAGGRRRGQTAPGQPDPWRRGGGHGTPSGLVSPAPAPAHRIPPWAHRTHPRSRPPRHTSSAPGCTCPSPCTGTHPHHTSFVLAGRQEVTGTRGAGVSAAGHTFFTTGLVSALCQQPGASGSPGWEQGGQGPPINSSPGRGQRGASQQDRLRQGHQHPPPAGAGQGPATPRQGRMDAPGRGGAPGLV